jgi:hypothetical protein
MSGYLAMNLFVAALGIGRPIEIWTYKQLFSQADVVIIANSLGTVDAPKSAKEKRKGLIGVNSTLKILYVIKGKPRGKKLILFHYRRDPNSQIKGNGALLVEFKSKTESKEGPDYLLFLKKRPDRRYECVTGQIDANLSVKLLVRADEPEG